MKLTKDLGKGYSIRYLYDFRKLYLFLNVHPVGAKLTMSHYRLQDIIYKQEYKKIIKCNKRKANKQRKTKNKYEELSEKTLQKLILEDIPSFLKELGNGFTFIENEYKIKFGDRYNYIDLLLYNIKFKCYVVVELKISELKKEHIGQIQTYINYLDKHIKTIDENKNYWNNYSKKR